VDLIDGEFQIVYVYVDVGVPLAPLAPLGLVGREKAGGGRQCKKKAFLLWK